MTKKILTVIGARPQFMKEAIFHRELLETTEYAEVMVHTGQHYDANMSGDFFGELGIAEPDYNLSVNGGSCASQVSRMVQKLEEIVHQVEPDMIVIFGDTNSTLAGALVGAYNQIPVAHVEAGFRSNDMSMPEEVNRILADKVSTLLFCCTKSNAEQLKHEGLTTGVHVTGDIMYDAALHFSSVSPDKEQKVLETMGVSPGNYLLCTIHRQNNVEDKQRLKSIFDGLLQSGEKIILPLHPRTRKRLQDFGLWDAYAGQNIHFTEPVGYVTNLLLIKNAKKIVTDSGGVLREAYFLKKTCIVVRDNIEFHEGVESGEIALTGAQVERITEAIGSFRSKGEFYPFFGSPDAGKRIVDIVRDYLEHDQ
ncbi:MAG: non-hydrolyzing UDP-N-acetylglucosamine 2-epimerase [Nanoarchaeota archaeon]